MQHSEERQCVMDDFEAELLADLEQTDHQVKRFPGGYLLPGESENINKSLEHSCFAQDSYEPEHSPRKRQKYEAPGTPDVSDTTWKKQTGLLGQLPLELVLRMFGFLSAEDLAVSAQACRYLASVSSQDELWKRLYCARYAVLFHLSLVQ